MEGLNPYGATMAPDMQMVAPGAAPPPGQYPGAPQGAPPPGQYPGAAPQGPYPGAVPGPYPGAPPGPYPGAPPGPYPGAVPAPVQDAQGRWIDPAAFAATAPPPTQNEHQAGQPPGPANVSPAADASPAAPAAASPAAPPPGAPAPVEGQAAPAPLQPGPAEPAQGVDPEQVPADAARVLSGFLVSFEEADQGVFWPLYQGKNAIGRAGAAEGLDIEIDHATTSSSHAVILASARPGRMKLQDQGSTNGTFVDDQRLPAETVHELSDGSSVRFGGYSAIVKIV